MSDTDSPVTRCFSAARRPPPPPRPALLKETSPVYAIIAPWAARTASPRRSTSSTRDPFTRNACMGRIMT